jgi:UDP-N-acetylmuramoyl-tripeptide--D-alanyl-D-alanine ligase
MELALDEIAVTVGGSLSGGPDSESFPTGVSIDSRTVKKGDLFFAISGPRFDGHDFVDAAFKAGACAAVVNQNKAEGPPRGPVLAVGDTVEALGRLASYYRDKLRLTVVAVTGSNGKTSTKDLVAHVLAGSRLVGGTQGNLNNYLGVPLTLLSLRTEHEIAVVEMGASRRGEIGLLSRLAKPQIGVITNVGPTHLEEMGTIEAVAATKAELAAALPHEGALILNGDDDLLVDAVSSVSRPDLRTVKCGFGPGTDLRAISSESLGETGTRFEVKGFGVATVPALGRHNVYNALMAIAVGLELGLEPEAIRRRLAGFKPPAMRLQLLRLGGIVVLNDCYNSNPASADAALKALQEYPSRGRRVAALGDMLELGAEAESLHRGLGSEASSVDWLLTTGRWAREVADAAVAAGLDAGRADVFGDLEELTSALLEGLKPGDVVLVKASRAIGMEKVAQALEGRLPKGS